ncbi:hypothetical protein [Actinoplanes sp. TBRC 11911]|uniref:hypothetical protein n=1 Tax=Actinoplanes sp. TBRC 11911 TaxID=2729386 RepID=UPI002897C9D3|nr:hypothetical protein [Actinoplanes sp. TBRC 11911]
MDRLASYMRGTGFFAFITGDPVTAQEYQLASIDLDVDAGDVRSLERTWRNLIECLGHVGDIDAAWEAAEESTAVAARVDTTSAFANAAEWRGWLLTLLGESRAAEERFMFADRLEYAEPPGNDHMFSFPGVWWAEFLVRTGRHAAARTLTDANRRICAENGWNDDLALCDRILGSLDLTVGRPHAAREKVAAAVVILRDGDFLVELALTLTMLAECARADGDLDAADQHVAEALTLAGPRKLVLAQAAALAVRAGIHADRAAAGDPAHLGRGRDDADSALRLAVRHRLAWHELDALDAHARLDVVAGKAHGWAGRAAALRGRLIPAGLDPDPLSTVERQVAAERAKNGESNI